MIRYRPQRSTLSASLKDEQVFSTLGEMLQYVFEKCISFSHYVGSEPPALRDLDIVSLPAGQRLCGYRNECMVVLRQSECVGYCGE